MSASSTKAMPELIKEALEPLSLGISPEFVPAELPPDRIPSSRDALQALLAFSCMHDQVRRRTQQAESGEPPSAEAWDIEPFLLHEVLQLVAERGLAITGADGVAIALADGNQVVCLGSAGSIAPDRGVRLDLNSSFSGACFRNSQIVRCDDSESDSRVDVQACRRLGARSMVAVPMMGRRNGVGLIEAFSAEPYGFNDCDVLSLNLLGELILAAIRPEEAEELAQVSERISSELKSAEAVSEPVCEAVDPNDEPLFASAVFRHDDQQETAVDPDDEPLFATAALAPAAENEFQPSVSTTPIIIPVQRTRPGLAVVMAVVAVAALFGFGLWWKIHTKVPKGSTASQPIAAASTPMPTRVSESATEKIDDVEVNSSSLTEEKLAVLPKVTGIRHWSATGTSTVVIDLQDQVQYEAHRLASPDRIYFDLHDTALAPALSGKTIEVGDSLLLRVRVAQPMAGVTRVVLETTGDPNFSISLEPNPYRLVAELRAIGAKPQSKAQFDLFRAPNDKNASPLAPSQAANASDARLRAQVPKFRIVVDAGHGGWDLGTVGRKGLLEKDLVLDITQRVGALLSDRLNAEVVYTRRDDTYIPLEDRAGIANQAQADLFLSVHANYSASAAARGVETYYTNTFSSLNARSRSTSNATLQDVNWGVVDIREKVRESRKFAASVQHSLSQMLAQKNPAIRNRGVKEASYVVLTGTSMPAILAEVSFVSSPTDEDNLQDAAYRQKIALALYKGIAGYVVDSHHIKVASSSGAPGGK